VTSLVEEAAAPALPRFSWPVRIIIFLVLFHMIYRSTDVLYPWEDWLHELKIERMPRPLPTRGDLTKLLEKSEGSYEPVIKEFKECFASLPRYWNPAPKEESIVLLDATQIRWGGLRLNKLQPKQRREHGLGEGVGLLIMAVDSATTAERGALKVGDVLIRVQDRPVPDDPDPG